MSDGCCDTCATPAPPREASPPLWRQRRDQLIRQGTAGLMVGAGSLAEWLAAPRIGIALYAIAIALCLPAPARRAWTSATKRVLDINVLMLVAVAGGIA